LSEEKAKKIIKTWLETEFSNEERHIRRLNKIREYENA
jgi:ribose 5-phosphate isomerase RpiB